MSRLDDLPADQRATLSLLLRQRKDYAQVAQLLQIAEQAVHDRAHAALAVLAPLQAGELTPQGREEIGEYLLGQRTTLADRLRARSLLERSAAARAWAQALAAELQPLAAGSLPEIPVAQLAGDRNGAAPSAPSSTAPESAVPESGAPEYTAPESAAPASGAGTAARGAGDDAGRTPAPGLQTVGGGPPGGAPSASSARDGSRLPSSRVGGAIVLALIVAAVVAVVLVTTSGGSSHHHASAAAAGSATSTTGAGTAASRATETKRLTLTPASSSSQAIGVAAVLQEGSTYAFYLAAERLAPSHGFFYAVWLYNSPTSYEPLSKSPPVGSNGRLQGGALLPSNAASYHQMILTRETSEHPARPGPIVLRGEFALH
jgi:hypothetical protein